MNQQQFEALKNVENLILSGSHLQDKTPRTLLYGYTCSRDDWHVYLDHSGEIQAVIYAHKDSPVQKVKITENRQFVPDKRLYPEHCDFEFCSLLAHRGIHLPFTYPTFENQRNEAFVGKTY